MADNHVLPHDIKAQRDETASTLRFQRQLDKLYNTNLAVQLLEAMQNSEAYQAWADIKKDLRKRKTHQDDENVGALCDEILQDGVQENTGEVLHIPEAIEELQESLKQ